MWFVYDTWMMVGTDWIRSRSRPKSPRPSPRVRPRYQLDLDLVPVLSSVWWLLIKLLRTYLIL